MKKILALLFLAATLCAAAQDTTVNRMEYFIDTDPGIGKGTSVTIPAGGNVTFSFTANLTGYAKGNHKLYIRTRDNLGTWSFTARRTIEVLPLGAGNNVLAGEYFFDTDPGFGFAAAIIVTTPDTAIFQNFNATTSGLAEGYHKLYGRFKDTYGNWSQTFRRNIEVIKSADNNVVNGEYFFINDNGFGNCNPVAFSTPAADGTFSFNIPLSQIPPTADTLFIRVRDDIENKWSLTQWIDSLNVTVLPLTLLNFTATKQNTLVKLNWQTTNEINTSHFNIQRSTDGTIFSTVGKVTANGSGVQTNYLFADDVALLKAATVFYRLQMTDQDGGFTYSSVDYVIIDDNSKTLTIYPNPAHNYFVTGKYNNRDKSNISLVIRDMAGRLLISRKFTNTVQQKVDISSLSRGIYMVSIFTGDEVHTQKLMVE